MIIEEILVRNWRGFREEHRFELAESLNVLVGLNEAGKSTLFEVLQRTFFDRFNGSSQELKAMQPIGSTLGPEAEIIARVGGRRHRIVKRFLQNPVSEFFSFRGDGWELDHDGDVADQEIRELLEGQVPGRGAAKEEHRGLAQALWYLQREAALPDQTWNEAVRKGLQGLVEVAASSPIEEAVLRKIEDAYGEHWTRTGQLAKRSPVKELEEEIPGLEAELVGLQARLAEGDEHRRSLEHLLEEMKGKKETVETLEAEADELRTSIESKEVLAAELTAAERELETLQAQEKDLEKIVKELEELEERIQEAEAAVETARDALGDEKVAEDSAKKQEEFLRNQLKNTIAPRRWEVEERLNGLQALRDKLGLLEEKERLLDRKERLEVARRDREELQGKIRTLVAPSAEDLEAYRKAAGDLDLVRAKAEAVAIRVAFDLSEAIEISTDPPADTQEGGEYLITSSTKFDLSGLGTITVSGGGEDLKELQAELARLEEARATLQARFGLEDEAGFVAAHREKEGLKQQLEKLEATIAHYREDGDPADEISEVEERLREKEALTGKLGKDDLNLGSEALTREISALTEERDQLQERHDDLSSKAEEARELYLAAIHKRGKAESDLTEQRSTRQGYQRQVSDALKPYGTREHLDSLLEDKASAASEASRTVKRLREAFREQVEKPKAALDDLQGQTGGIKASLHQDEIKEAQLRSALETLSQQNLYSQIGDLEASIEGKKSRRETLRRRAEGAKALWNLVQGLQQERAGALAGPVSERLSVWLAELTDGVYESVSLSSELKPAEVRFSRYDANLGVGELSHGTQEQLVVLLRLAIAISLSQEERQLIVLDDRLVNSDPIRMRRFRPILQEAAESCQILLATCQEAPYAGLPGRVIRVPEDGRA